MKNILLIAFTIQCHTTFSQRVSLPKLNQWDDTAKSYYLSSCEEFYSLFRYDYNYEKTRPDSCLFDFTLYDLSGIRVNDTIQWSLVSPKKYTDYDFKKIPSYDSLDWFIYPKTMIIEDSFELKKVQHQSKTLLKNPFDSIPRALIYNEVWIDCNGHFYYRILYDKAQNLLICKLFKIYAGCRGMRVDDSWILIDKPNPDTRIELQSFWVH